MRKNFKSAAAIVRARGSAAAMLLLLSASAQATTLNIIFPEVVGATGTGFDSGTAVGTTTLGTLRQSAMLAAANVLNQSLPGHAACVIDVDATFGGGGLAGASPLGFTANVAGGVVPAAGNAAYAWGLENYILNNNPARGGSSDISIQFNPAISWYYGSDGRPPSTQFDMLSTAFHELIHGLGYYKSFEATGTTWGGRPATGGRQTVYDSFMRNNAGNQFTGPGTPNPVPAGTTTNNVTWGGVNGILANGTGLPRPLLFSPNPYQSGSSLSHTDETAYWGAFETMTPTSPAGEGFDFIDPVVQGQLMDMGYTLKSLRKFWTSPSGSNAWSTPTSWWDPQNPVAGSVPVATDRVVIQQPRLDPVATVGSVVTLDQNATVKEVVLLSSLVVSGGNLTLTQQGLTNGGSLTVSNGKKLTTTTADNIVGAYLPTSGGLANSYACRITVTGANSQLAASGTVNNNSSIVIKGGARFSAGNRFNNFNDPLSDVDINTGGRLVLNSVLSNGSAAKIHVKDPTSRLLVYNGSTVNDGLIELRSGGQAGFDSMTNIGTISIADGSNVAGNNSRAFVVGSTANYGTIALAPSATVFSSPARFDAPQGTINNYGTFTRGRNTVMSYGTYNEFGHYSVTVPGPNTAPTTPLPQPSLEDSAIGSDFTVCEHGVLTGGGAIVCSGDFRNQSVENTEYNMRSARLAFIEGNVGEASHLQTQSSDLNLGVGSYSGGRVYADHIAMETTTPTLPSIEGAVDDPASALGFGVPAGVPTLDVLDGAIYLLDNPANGLAELEANISSGAAEIVDSLNSGRPLYDPLDPQDSIIRLVSGSPGSAAPGFVDNFALGSLEIYGSSDVLLSVPEPTIGLAAIVLFGTDCLLRRRKRGDTYSRSA